MQRYMYAFIGNIAAVDTLLCAHSNNGLVSRLSALSRHHHPLLIVIKNIFYNFNIHAKANLISNLFIANCKILTKLLIIFFISMIYGTIK